MTLTAPRLTEAQWQKQVLDLAHTYGWRCAHFATAIAQSGRWMTPVRADGKGFPDLVCVRRGRLIFAELKAARGRVRAEQVDWLADLSDVADACPNVSVFLWRPEDLELITEELKRD